MNTIFIIYKEMLQKPEMKKESKFTETLPIQEKDKSEEVDVK